MEIPVKLNFFKSLEIYQQLKDEDRRLGNDNAWQMAKHVLKWFVENKKGIDDYISTRYIEESIYNGEAPQSATQTVDNHLLFKGYFEKAGDGEIKITPFGYLTGKVLYDMNKWYGSLYPFFIALAWITMIAGAIVIIGAAIKIIIDILTFFCISK